MVKRTADVQISDRDPDGLKDAEEDATGEPKQADATVLATRKMIKGKRKGPKEGASGTFSGFSFGVKKDDAAPKAEPSKTAAKADSPKKAASKEAAPAAKTGSIWAKAKADNSGKWQCTVCNVFNANDLDKCASCETPKPKAGAVDVAKPKPDAAKSDEVAAPKSSGIWAKASNSTATKASGIWAKAATPGWQCQKCLVYNKADDTKCAACDTAKPGEAASSPAAVGKAAAVPAATGTSGFKFGASSVKPATTTGGFKFGGSTSTATTAASSDFKFGASK